MTWAPARGVTSGLARAPERALTPSRAAVVARGVALAATLATGTLPALPPLAAQGIGESLSRLDPENGRRYVRPVSSGLSAALTAGWFDAARPLGFLEFRVGARILGSFVPDRDESFQPVLPELVRVEGLGEEIFRDPFGTGEGVLTPTAVGDGPGAVILPQGALARALREEGFDPVDFALVFPGGFDLPAVPLAALEVGAGLPFGTEIAVRFLPNIEVDDDVGSVESLGVGLEHSLSQWLPDAFPLDLAVAGGFQSLDVSDYLSVDARFVQLLASKRVGGLTLFTSARAQEADAEIEFTVRNPRLPEAGTRIRLEEQGPNDASFTGGLQLELLFLRLTAAYTLADHEVADASLSIVF